MRGVALSVVMLSLGGYAFLERAQLAILSAMVACIFIAAIYVRPDWWQVVQGLFVPRQMEYPSWAIDLIPGLQERTLSGRDHGVCGGSWRTELRLSGVLCVPPRERMGPRTPRDRRGAGAPAYGGPSVASGALWVRAALVDTVLSFAAIVLIATVSTILGTAVLQPQRLVPDGVDLLNHQARFLTALSPWLLPLYQAAVLLAFFGSLYVGPEMTLRIIHEYS